MAKVTFKPLGARVLIETVEQEEVTAGGIVLPETAKEKPQQGKVLAAGPGDRNEDGERIAMDVKVGDICFSPSTLAPKSRWTARNCSSCARVIFSVLSDNKCHCEPRQRRSSPRQWEIASSGKPPSSQ